MKIKEHTVTLIPQGGVGNQLFAFCAAFYVAHKNNAKLAIDPISGFKYDYQYNRKYELDKFHINEEISSKKNLLHKYGKLKYAYLKLVNKYQKIGEKNLYIQNGMNVDKNIIEMKVNKNIYLMGYWQGLDYIKPIENLIKEKIIIKDPIDNLNTSMADEIEKNESVALHLRNFNTDGIMNRNTPKQFYIDSINSIKYKLNNPKFYIFSDDLALVEELTQEIKVDYKIVNINSKQNAVNDLWLMSKCKNFIVPRSTFSWWGAYLSKNKNKIIYMTKHTPDGAINWGEINMYMENAIVI